MRFTDLLLLLGPALILIGLGLFYIHPEPLSKVKVFKGYEDTDWLVVDDSGKVIGHIRKPVYSVETVWNLHPASVAGLILEVSGFLCVCIAMLKDC